MSRKLMGPLYHFGLGGTLLEASTPAMARAVPDEADDRQTGGLNAAVWTIAIVATVMFLRVAYELMIPIVLGVLISFALNPLVAWLEKVHLPRVVGAGLILITLATFLGLGIYSLRDEATEVIEGLPRAAQRVRESMERDGSSGILVKLRQAVEEVKQTADATTGASAAPDQKAAATESRGAASVISLLGHATVIFFLVYFLLIGGAGFKNRLISVAGRRRRVTAEILDDISWQVQRFLVVRLVTSVIVGIATWTALALMGVEQAMFWGVAAGVFNSIPYFGPIIVSGGLAVVGLLQFGSVIKAVQVAGVALVITSLEGWLLTPPMMGRAARMNALTVFVGLLVWSWIWGIWGTILAVPMLATMKAVCDHIEGLKPIGRLMGE
jgi:predicted PurR-regulated permease PerM